MPRMVAVVCPSCKSLHHLAGSTKCGGCRREDDRKRATPEQRGYDAAHRRLRASYLARQRRGETLTCARCGDPITPDEEFDLGHTDDRTAWTGPEHAARCNRSAAGREGAAIKNLFD